MKRKEYLTGPDAVMWVRSNARGRDISMNVSSNEDGSIDIEGDIDLRWNGIIEIPVKFRNVTGDFDCSFNQLKDLHGSPDSVRGCFIASNNVLTDLVGCPKYVSGSIYLSGNKLKNLTGVPSTVVSIYCSNNELVDLSGAPDMLDFFLCNNNMLTSLEGAPRTVNCIMNIESNKDLLFIDGAPVVVRNISASWTLQSIFNQYIHALYKIPIDVRRIIPRRDVYILVSKGNINLTRYLRVTREERRAPLDVEGMINYM